MTERSVVVVLAARGAVTSGVRDVVRDWAALGLISPFLWVEEAAVDPGRPLGSVVATRISAVEARRVRLQDELANTQNLRMVRLVSLGVQGSKPSLVSPRVATHMVNGLSQGGVFRFSPLQLILTRHGGNWVPDFEQEGWRTLVVAPEDAFSPTRPATEILDEGDDTEAIAHSASALVTVGGMWSGMEEGPFDAEAVGVAEPRVVRTFLRRLDASPVANDIRAVLTDVTGGLPKPHSTQGSSSYFQNPAAAVERMASTVLGMHQDLFTFHEQEPEGDRIEQKSWWRAIVDFLIFLKQAVLSAPRELIDNALNRSAAAVSRRVQSAVYGGTDSRYEVVTRGINARGLPFGSDEVAATARKVAQRSAEAVNSTEQSLRDLSAFWRDVIAAGLTLADAGVTRLPGVEPQLVDGLPGVVPETLWVAPAPGDAFVLTGTAVARTQLVAISPYDAQTHQAANEVLTQVAREEMGAGRAKEQFDQWCRRMETTYTGRIGQRLSAELTTRQERLAELMEAVSHTEVPEVDGALAEEHQKLKRTFRRWLLGFIGIAVVAVLIGVLGIIGIVLLTVLSFAAALGWGTRGVVKILGHQQKMFAELNARKAASDAINYAAANLALAASALYRVATLYSQYLAWAPILGRFLREPFGPPPPRPTPARLKGLLPRSVGFGVAVSDPTVVANIAAELSRQVFEPGWLSDLWTAMVRQAPDQLGPQAVDIRSNPQALLTDAAGDASSLLRKWSALIAESGIPAGVGDEMWRRSRDALVHRGLRDLSASLFKTVEVQAQESHGITAPLGGDSFFTVLTDSLADPSEQAFLTALFQAQAQAQGLHRVASTVAVGPEEVESLAESRSSVRWIRSNPSSQSGLDQFLVVLQLTPPISSAALTIHRGEMNAVQTSAEVGAPEPSVTIVDVN